MHKKNMVARSLFPPETKEVHGTHGNVMGFQKAPNEMNKIKLVI